MGWKGTLRSINSAIRAAEREAERQRKAEYKAQVASEAAQAVKDWENHINDLISVHVDLADAIDWQSMAKAQKPVEPNMVTRNRDIVEPELKRFKAGMFDFLSGGTENKKQRLIAKFKSAGEQDISEHRNVREKYKAELADWEADNSLAKRLISGETKAIKEVISETQSISEEGLIGNNVRFRIGDQFVHAIPEVHTDEVVPNFRRKQLASGRLSETKMPAGQFNELYQDYVASVALKVAGDLFHILPLDELWITCCTTMLNSQTGHQEVTPILSVQFVRLTFVGLNLATVDPSNCLKNFNHQMKFKKNKGFEPVIPLQDF